MYSWISRFYAKCWRPSSTYKALHDPWSHFIFGLWWVSLAEYLLVLRVYFPLVADNTVYHGYCKHCFCPAMDEEYAMGKALLYIYSIMLLWDVITNWQVFEQWCEILVSKLLCFRYYFIWTWLVITLIGLWCMVRYLWTLCNMWHVC